MARKCSLPVRPSVTDTGLSSEDGRPKEISEEKVEELALRAFIYDYCVVSMNHNLSRGFLDGLELMLHRLGLHSDLAKACMAVSFASHGIKLCRPSLTEKAETMYHELLVSLAKALENPSVANSAESLMITTILGLYEMIMAREAHSGYHRTHAGGVAALLCIRSSPLDLLAAVRGGLPPIWKGVVRGHDVFYIPCSDNAYQSLDDLLIKSGVLLERADVMLANSQSDSIDLRILRNEATVLSREFIRWQDAQVDHFKPTAIGCVSQGRTDSVASVGLWPGQIDAYFDLYVAAVWNTFRAVRLQLIALTLDLSKAVNDDQDDTCEQLDAHRLLQDMISSIPYHLTEDLHGFLRAVEKNTVVMHAGRDVGGLLLMHPLYIVSKLLIVPPQMRDYMRSCLTWIGESMGIGQASLFAKDTEFRKDYLTSGCMLAYAGLLL
ncbi:hypothetical protein EV356DRAFT_538131 [Viridothelium virens]|uniref:C6 transcription factor n=1 Tax=Viridothelium virens TaxID=1048519 RepID=A0A6A6GS64_VIRVR|nr:hypothetical protein EV356DRAFT_538131 [Viridothelium virens]